MRINKMIVSNWKFIILCLISIPISQIPIPYIKTIRLTIVCSVMFPFILMLFIIQGILYIIKWSIIIKQLEKEGK